MKRTLSNLFWSRPEKRRTNARGFRPSFESLEDRRVMAVNILEPIGAFGPAVNSPGTLLTAGVKDGTLYVRGTDKPDTITLRQQNNAIKIDGLVGSYNINNFQNIVIRSFGSNDVINLKSEAVKSQQAITKPASIWSGSGIDTVTGGRGNDTIFAEAGNDKVWGNWGDDLIDAGLDNDEVHGDAGNDKIFGDHGSDKLWGDDNNDILLGGDNMDWIYGGKGSDRIDGGLEYDYLYGEADYDYLQDDSASKSDSGADTLTGELSWAFSTATFRTFRCVPQRVSPTLPTITSPAPR
jgi:Ca2+-binding RTX toxin-like protein